MRRPEGENARIVDENIDMTVSKFDRPACDVARARCVSKVRLYVIGFASRCTDFANSLLASFRIAAYDYDMDAKLG